MSEPDTEKAFELLGKATFLCAVIDAMLDSCTTPDLLMRAQMVVASHTADYPGLVAAVNAEIDRRLAAMGAPVEPPPEYRRW